MELREDDRVTSLQKGSVCTMGRVCVNFPLNVWPWISFMSCCRHPMAWWRWRSHWEIICQLKNQLILTTVRKNCLPTQKLGLWKSVTDVFKGFFFFCHFQLELEPQLLGKSCLIFSFSAPSIPQCFHHQLNEFQLSRELIRSVICLFLFPSLNKQEKCF